VGALLAFLACVGAATPAVRADDTVQLHLDTSEADAVLAILARRTAGEAIPDSDWQRLFGSEPYLRLKRREAEMKRSFEDSAFREFVMSDALLAKAADLEKTLAAWKHIDLDASARSVLGYLPAQARIRAKVFPVIKPRTNSFVFDVKEDPTIFLYLDPAVSAAQFANTVRHELHHIGLGSVAAQSDLALKDLPPRAKAAADWMGGFGEGMAMLAAAGGPDVHPHADSAPEDRARWDRDVANFSRDLHTVERFFLDVIDGRLKGEDAIREKAFTFFGVQGPWYTVGWKMAVIVEKAYGRPTLIDCMLDPRRLLATYNRAVNAGKAGEPLPTWSGRLLRAVRAHPVGPAS
jgi:hypothetical protein